MNPVSGASRPPVSLPCAEDFFGIDLVKSIMKKPLRDRPLWATDERSVREAVDDFRRFFYLMATHPGENLVPTVTQDDVWHAFLMHPVAYHEACIRHCGTLIDHDGGFGLTDDERPVLEDYKRVTMRLWETVFGFPHPSDPRSPARACCSTCAPCATGRLTEVGISVS
jgi:hypothetical protein